MNSSLGWISSKRWILLKMSNLHNNDKIFIKKMNLHQHYEFSIRLWMFIKWNLITMMNFLQNDKFSSQWWISIIMINFHHNHRFSSQCWIFIRLNSSLGWLSSKWWILLTMSNFPHNDNFHHKDESSSELWILIRSWIFITMKLNHNDEFSSGC